MRIALALFAVALLGFLPFFGYPEWRGTEARRVEIAHSMVETGDLVVPRLWNEPTYAKPPFYYWVLAGLIAVFGQEPWAMRLPSLLGFFALALVAFRCLDRWHDRRTAWLGAIGVLVAPVVMYDAPFAEIDPVFAVLCVLSVLLLSEGVYAGCRAGLVLAGVLGGLAVMTKGPPYLMFCAGPFVLWYRRNRLRGILWYLPWVFAFYIVYKLVLDHVRPADDTGAVAVEESLGRLRFWEGEALKGIPAHLLQSFVVIGLPFSFWFVPWFRSARRATDLATERSRFLLWGALGAVVVLLFSTGRSTRYLLPAVPLVILGLAPLAARSLETTAAPPRWVRRALAVFGALAGGLGLLALPWLPHPYPGTTALALAALGCVGFCVWRQRHLVVFALAVCPLIAWSAFPDRLRYHRNADDFVPDAARVFARELNARRIAEVDTYAPVNTSLLLHMREHMDRLAVHSDFFAAGTPTRRFVMVQDRGYVKRQAAAAVDVRDLPGYREVLRVQTARNKSVSLRERR